MTATVGTVRPANAMSCEATLVTVIVPVHAAGPATTVMVSEVVPVGNVIVSPENANKRQNNKQYV